MPVVDDLGLVRIKKNYRPYVEVKPAKKGLFYRLGEFWNQFLSGKSFTQAFGSVFLILFAFVVVPGTTYLLVHQPELEGRVEASESLVRLSLNGTTSSVANQLHLLTLIAFPDGNQLCGADLNLTFDPQNLRLVNVSFPHRDKLPTVLPLNAQSEFDQEVLLKQANQTGQVNLTLLTFSLESSTMPVCLGAEVSSFELTTLVFESLTAQPSVVKFDPLTKVKILRPAPGQFGVVNVSLDKPVDSIGLWLSPGLELPARTEESLPLVLPETNVLGAATESEDDLIGCLLIDAECFENDDCCSGICKGFLNWKTCRE